ncbi:MAG: 30S ribosomal protein S12 methylthiotransferase RimO [Spirochaetales bacterium]|nr:30S ribosomal protein S12 methylthiotransferase RimO [Spirochaetales bacterium]
MPEFYKYYIENLGCAKNQVDAETIITLLSESGCARVIEADQADLIIVNSCGFIEKAKRESITTTLYLREKYPGKKIILAGCLTERYFDQLRKEMAEIDGFAGNSDLNEVKEVSLALLRGDKPSRDKRKIKSGNEVIRNDFLSFPGSAYIKIAEGCSNYCSYCSIPYIRGKLVSRTIRSIREEIETLHRKGIVEFNLIAQDLGAFGADRGKPEIVDLFAAISELKGNFWIRALYIHPDHFPWPVLEIMKKDRRFIPYFDLPFQHASKSVLLNMGRKGSGEEYLELTGRIRSEIPASVIRSTFLVGFPGETDWDFSELLEFQMKARLNWLGVFEYSREEGTRAYQLKSRVARRVARERREEIEKRQVPITEVFLENMIGKNCRVLVEEKVEGEKFHIGRCFYQAPEVDGLVVINADGLEAGQFVQCRITRRNGFDLEAVLAEDEDLS